jgi:hypothetical protein
VSQYNSLIITLDREISYQGKQYNNAGVSEENCPDKHGKSARV